jgi:hypothetical protein
MSWMVPEYMLDADQRAFLAQLGTDNNQNYWIKGFAGSGKSVLALWSVVRLRRDNPDLSVCIVLYTHSLIDLFETGIPAELNDVPVITYLAFKKSPRQFDVIMVDEVQDLPEDVVSLLRNHSKRLILAGDEAQSIYDQRVDSDRIPVLAGANSYPLTILHRLTSKIIEMAQTIFPDKRLDTAKRSRMKNVDVTLATAKTEIEEVKYVWSKAKLSAVPGVPAAVLLPNHSAIIAFVNGVLEIEGHDAWQVARNRFGKLDYEAMNSYLGSCGLSLQYVGSKHGSLKSADNSGMVVLMTYHSSKGLDFETVFLPFLCSSTSIWRDDPVRERTLFFVALTRSRLNLFLSYTDRPHHLISKIPYHLVRAITVPEESDTASKAFAADKEIYF